MGGNAVQDRAPHALAEPIPIRLVPYYAWANRGIGEMTVWLRCVLTGTETKVTDQEECHA